MHANPHLFEANACWLLRRLSEQYSKPLTLATVPEKEWKSLSDCGMDILWLMGVWKRSSGGRQKALNDPGLQQSYRQALPDWTENDVAGSPYAIFDYSLDPSLGGEGDLRELKERLNRLGLRLMLDFVPNHLAFDHPWTLSHPEYFIQPSASAKVEHPEFFFESRPGVYLAHGRDPYFPPWSDTVQINYFSPAAREAMVGELLKIAEVCDGVRCDMAMLPLNDIFKRIWGAVARGNAAGEFWQKAIDCIRRKKRDFIFMAEAYWNTEWQLHALGFDYTYDKIFYDRLLHSNAEEVRGHLLAGEEYQARSARFIENHDEKRAVAAFTPNRSQAAAMAAATVPGLRFFYDGQFEGRTVHTPIQLDREPREKISIEMNGFYQRLMEIIKAPFFHEGKWKLLSASQPDLLAWCWELGPDMVLVIINYSQSCVQGRVKLPRRIRGAKKISFSDRLHEVKYDYPADEINDQGIYVDLEPWSGHILEGPMLEKGERE